MLDQQHMRIGCRMQDDMRRTGAQQAIHAAGITYRSEKWHDVHVDLRCLSQPPELSINLIKREFAMIDEHQTFGREGQHLPAQLAADRPSGPGYENDLAENILFKKREVRLHRAAPEQDRTSVVSGKSVSVRVELGGRRIIKKKNNRNKQ